MTSLVNGTPCNHIPTSDRGLLYGDGVFETIAIREGQPRHWPRHMNRLRAGCTRLGIPLPDCAQLAAEAENMISGIDKGVLKLILTRGSGGRGYQVPGATSCTRILQLHPWPDYPDTCAEAGVKTRLCEMRLARNPALAGIKHLNRLEQVLARQEWSNADIREGLLMDTEANLVEGTMSNLFIVSNAVLMTPPLSHCGVAGIMRSLILELAGEQGLNCRVTPFDAQTLLQADEVFLCNSLIGIWPVIEIDETLFSKGAITMKLQAVLRSSSDTGSAWQT